MKKLMSIVCVVFFALAGTGFSQDTATKEECMAKCEEAARMVKEKGLEAAIAAIMAQNSPFVWKDTYIFCIDTETKNTLAHPIKPKLVGKSLMHVKDTNGKLFFAEFVTTAKEKGAGWVEYMWPKPGEKEPSRKITYVYKVPDENALMGSGIYAE